MKPLLIAMVLAATIGEAHAETDPCTDERATADRLDREMNAPGWQRIAMDYQHARDALIACERRAEDAEQSERLARLNAERSRQAAEKEERRKALQAERDAQREKELAEAAAKRRSEQEMRDRIAADPRSRRIAFSALLCGSSDEERTALREISDYRKAARIGGVLNLTEINNGQEEVMLARKEQARARSVLRAMKVKPLTCADPLVTKVSRCVVVRTAIVSECDAEARALSAVTDSNQ